MTKRVIRSKEIKRRKNFLPTLIITVAFWVFTGIFVYTVNPESKGAIPAFLLAVFVTFLFTFSSIFTNTRRGFFVSSGIVIFLILRYFGIGNILNLFLLAGTLTIFDLHFTKKSNS